MSDRAQVRVALLDEETTMKGALQRYTSNRRRRTLASARRTAPRGVLHTWANPDGTQKIDNTGPIDQAMEKRTESLGSK